VNETLQDALDILTENDPDFLIGRDIREINQLCHEVQRDFKNSPGARTGLETALYDLFSQYLKVPLVYYLGRKIYSMPTSVTVGIKGVQETIDEAEEYIERKFKILKIKLGRSLEEDIERLVKLREKFGDKMSIIVDANQGYTEGGLVYFHQQTASLNIELIEQPLKVGKEKNYRRLPKEIKKKTVADESLITPEDAIILASEPGACGYFNIKLMKCGGISEALKIADIAYSKRTGLMWGCNDESIISITAALHTAFACPGTKYIDLDGSLDLAEDVVKGGFILKDGIMSLPDKPGLGLDYL
jgi:L-alanine-DL-glutamate epimerase-like enolase superfamily enzyme